MSEMGVGDIGRELVQAIFNCPIVPALSSTESSSAHHLVALKRHSTEEHMLHTPVLSNLIRYSMGGR